MAHVIQLRDAIASREIWRRIAATKMRDTCKISDADVDLAIHACQALAESIVLLHRSLDQLDGVQRRVVDEESQDFVDIDAMKSQLSLDLTKLQSAMSVLTLAAKGIRALHVSGAP
jgi:hypothetical protein